MSTQSDDNNIGVEIFFLNNSTCISIDTKENTISILCYTLNAFGVILVTPNFIWFFFLILIYKKWHGFWSQVICGDEAFSHDYFCSENKTDGAPWNFMWERGCIIWNRNMLGLVHHEVPPYQTNDILGHMFCGVLPTRTGFH